MSLCRSTRLLHQPKQLSCNFDYQFIQHVSANGKNTSMLCYYSGHFLFILCIEGSRDISFNGSSGTSLERGLREEFSTVLTKWVKTVLFKKLYQF